MQLEELFEFESFPTGDRIRVKGTRIAIEDILYRFRDEGESAEQIFQDYRTLTLAQVYATITYYLLNQNKVDEYMRQARAADEAAYQEFLKQEPAEVVKRIRRIAAERANKSSAAG